MSTNKEMADKMYGANSDTAIKINKVKLKPQGANPKKKQVPSKATSTHPKGGM